jgi:hypothetical protein
MTTVLKFKSGIDIPKFKPLASAIFTTVGDAGLICDLRNNEDRHPLIYFVGGPSSPSTFCAYNVKNNGWLRLPNIGVGYFGSGFFMSAQGPRGTIAAGATTSSFTLTTVLPAAVGVNQLANRGDGRGFKVRIIGNSAGSSGKTEERLIVANTAGTAPTINIDTPFSFTPANGDAYEFLSGKAYAIGIVTNFIAYDVLTNSNASLSIVNSPATIQQDNVLVGLDELLVPYDRNPGEGFFGILTATGSAIGGLTGQAVGGDANVVADQYRNFQIRIVEDTTTTMAVGQRKNILTHTGGPSPNYTFSSMWVTKPSATAKYVIENNGDRILGWGNGSTQTFTYTISTNTWDINTTFIARPSAPASGMIACQAFSIEPDVALNARHSFIYSFRSASTNTLEKLDISGGAGAGAWTSPVIYGNNSTVFGGGTSFIQEPATNQGRYIYINQGNGTYTGNIIRFDMMKLLLEPYTLLRLSVTNVSIPAGATKFLAYTVFIDGNTKLSCILYTMLDTTGNIQLFFSLPIVN